MNFAFAGFKLESMKTYQHMWDTATFLNGTRDVGLFTDSSVYTFGLDIGLSASYRGYLRYVQSIKGNNVPLMPFQSVLGALEKVFNVDRKYADAEISVDEDTFPVHSQILYGKFFFMQSFTGMAGPLLTSCIILGSDLFVV